MLFLLFAPILFSEEFSLKGTITGFVALVAGNNAPQWNVTQTNFTIQRSIILNLSKYFVDNENETLTFAITQTQNISSTLEKDLLIVLAGESFVGAENLTIIASDSISTTRKTITIIKPKAPVENISIKKIEEDLTFNTTILSRTLTNESLTILFSHDSPFPQPVSVIGNVNATLSRSLAFQNEIIELKIQLVNQKVPRFRLKVGAQSDILEFGLVQTDPELEQKLLQKNKTEAIVIWQELPANLSNINAVITQRTTEKQELVQQIQNYTILEEYQTINAIVTNITTAQLQELQNNIFVKQIIDNKAFNISLQDSIPLIRADLVHNTTIVKTQNSQPETLQGKGQTVCILDTGINKLHPSLAGKIISEKDFVNNDNDAFDDNGHGTHVAGIVASNGDLKGVAPESNLVIAKVCNAQGVCDGANILAGLDYCTTNVAQFNITALSGSFGDGGSYTATTCPNYFDDSLLLANQIGITNIFASGNQFHQSGINYPACSPYSLSVGASTKSDSIAGFSNIGPNLDVLAPGENINSTWLAGHTTLSGTSMAVPHVSGLVALIQQHEKYNNRIINPTQIEDIIKQSGVDVGGYSRIDAYKTIETLQNLTKPINITPPIPTSTPQPSPTPPPFGILSHSGATINNCNQSIDRDADLNASLAAISNDSVQCFRFNASDINFNCQGLLVNFSGSTGSPIAFNFTNVNNITIRNCFITKYSGAIHAENSSNNTIFNNTINESGTTSSLMFIRFNRTSHNNAIFNNSIIQNTNTEDRIVFLHSSTSNNITNNRILNNSGGRGIFLFNGSNNTIIDANMIVTRDSIAIDVNSSPRVNISNNYINTSSASAIRVSNTSSNIFIINNSIITTTTSTAANGIFLEYEVITVNITRNIINITAGGSSSGILMRFQVNDTFIEDNNITINGSSAQGIRVNGSSNLNISRNLILMNGSANDVMINLLDRVNNTVIFNNTLLYANSTSSSDLIFVGGGSIRVNITNNTMNMSVPGDVFDFREGARDITIADNNILSQNDNLYRGITLRLDDVNQTVIKNQYILNYSIGNVTTFTIHNDSTGNITWTNLTETFSNINLSLHIRITSNNTFVNSTVGAVSGGNVFNSTANISLYSITFANPDPVFDFIDNGNYVSCGGNCTEVSITSNIFKFNVTRFTSYAAQAGPAAADCPQTLNTGTTTQANNWNTTTGNCVTINASNIDLNCAGYNITGGGNGIAINSTNFMNITIRNCYVVSNFSTGFYFLNSSNISVRNNTFMNMTLASVHINQSSNNVSFYNNTIITTSVNAIGVFVENRSNRVNITLNFINTSLANATHIINSLETFLINNTMQNSSGVDLVIRDANQTVLADHYIKNYSLTNLTIFTIQNVSTGNLTFLTNITASGTNLSNDIRIRLNSTFVNTSSATGFNTSANITLFNITLVDIVPMMDLEDDGTFTLCGSPICAEINLSSNISKFNVTRFTTYVNQLATECPFTPTSDVLLNDNANTTGQCVSFLGSNLIFDCAGFSISTTDTSGDEFAFNSTNFNNITIRNCPIFGFEIGVLLINSSNNTIRNISINASREHAILFNRTSSRNIITNSTIFAGQSGIKGIFIQNESILNNISDNFINASFDDSSSIAIFLHNQINDTIIHNNVIVSAGSDGIFINLSTRRTNITNNIINASNGAPIHGATNISDTFIVNNSLLSLGGGGANKHGIFLDGTIAPILKTNISYNVINVSSTASGIHNIFIINSNDTLIINNTLRHNQSGDGIRLNNSARVNISENFIGLFGLATSGDVISLFQDNNDTIISNNTIFVPNASGTDADVFQIGPRALRTNITNNTINVSLMDVFVISTSIQTTIANNDLRAHLIGNRSVDLNLQHSNITIIMNTGLHNYTITNATFFVYHNTSVGNITWGNVSTAISTGTIETRTNFTNDIRIGSNFTFVNTSTVRGFNSSANISLYGITFDNPNVWFDEEDISVYRPCAASRCPEISFTSNIFKFNVTRWSSYVSRPPFSCGDTVTEDTTLANNFTCPNSATVLQGSNFTLNCDGFNLTGAGSSLGINFSSGSLNISVINCGISNFTHGIYSYNQTSHTIRNNTVFNTSDAAIFLNASVNISIHNNTLITTAVIAEGIASVKHSANTSAYLNITENIINSTLGNGTYFEVTEVLRFTNNTFHPSGLFDFVLIDSNLTRIVNQVMKNFTIRNGTNISVINLSAGNITWIGNVTATGTNFTDQVQMGLNRTFVNSTEVPGFNTSAFVSFFNISSSFSNPQPYKSPGDDGTFTVCRSTSAQACSNLSYDGTNGIFRFNTTSFSTFAVQETPICGMTVNRDLTFIELLNCSGITPQTHGLRINASDVNVNCAGFQIDGTLLGINITNVDNATVRNCFISEAPGIFIENSSINTIRNNTITAEGFSPAGVIMIRNASSNNTIFNNTILSAITTGTLGMILAANSSHSNNITFNFINISAGGGSEMSGIRIENNVENTIIDNNIVTGFVSSINLIYLNNSVFRTNITNNIMNASTSGIGVLLSHNISNTTIFNNSIRTGTNVVQLYKNVTRTNITNNFFNSTGSTSAHMILVDEADDLIIKNNSLFFNATSSTTGPNYIRFNTSSRINITENLFWHGIIYSGAAIRFFLSVNDSVISNNTMLFTSTSDGTNKEGILIDMFANNINITNNTINLTSSAQSGSDFFDINASVNVTIAHNNLLVGGSRDVLIQNSTSVNLIDQLIRNYSFNRIALLTIANSTQGNVSYTTNITVDNSNPASASLGQFEVASLNVDFNITFNRVFVNSTRYPGFNASANISLYALESVNPEVLVDFEDDGTFGSCSSSICTAFNLSGPNGLATFSVTRFTTYQLGSVTGVKVTSTIADSAAAPAPAPAPPPPPPPPPPAVTLALGKLGFKPPVLVMAPIEVAGFNSVPFDVIKETNISCAFSPNETKSFKINRKPVDPKHLPNGYEPIEAALGLECDKIDFNLTINIPDNYEDIKILRCFNGDCKEVDNIVSRDKFLCAGIPIEQLRKDEYKQKHIDPSFSIEKNISLTINNNRLENGAYAVDYLGSARNIRIFFKSLNETLNLPPNPHILPATFPFIVKLNRIDEPMKVRVTMPVRAPFDFDNTTLAIYTKTNGNWRFVGGEFAASKNNTVSVIIPDIKEYLDENNEVLFGAFGTHCIGCAKTNLKKVFNGSSNGATILVHGFMSSPIAWQPLVDDFVLNKQTRQVWIYEYPSTMLTDDIAKEFAEHIERMNSNISVISFVGHSLGGIIIEKALAYASKNSQYTFPTKVEKAVILGSPHDGSPIVDQYQSFVQRIINEKSFATILNANMGLIQELRGRQNISIPEIPFYVIAGKKPYDLTRNLFMINDTLIPNDGVVSVPSAQHVGGVKYVNNTCKNYFETNLTHTEITDDSIPRRIITRLLNQKEAETEILKPFVGYNSYVLFNINSCIMNETIMIVGKTVLPEDKTPVPLLCACGNGACGIDETIENCPSDCAPPEEEYPALVPFEFCVKMNLVNQILTVLLLIILMLGAIDFARHKTLQHTSVLTMIITGLLLITAFVYQNQCKKPLPFTYLLLSFSILLFIAHILATRKLPKPVIAAKIEKAEAKILSKHREPFVKLTVSGLINFIISAKDFFILLLHFITGLEAEEKVELIELKIKYERKIKILIIALKESVTEARELISRFTEILFKDLAKFSKISSPILTSLLTNLIKGILKFPSFIEKEIKLALLKTSLSIKILSIKTSTPKQILIKILNRAHSPQELQKILMRLYYLGYNVKTVIADLQKAKVPNHLIEKIENMKLHKEYIQEYKKLNQKLSTLEKIHDAWIDEGWSEELVDKVLQKKAKEFQKDVDKSQVLTNYVKLLFDQGHDVQKIKEMLLNSGWPEKVINNIDMLKNKSIKRKS